MLRKIKDFIFLNDVSPQLRLALLEQYVANHKTNTWGVPLACVVTAMLLLQWEDPLHILIWLALGLSTSAASAFVFTKFEQEENKTPEKLGIWVFRLALPRLLFILNWTSIIIWGWDPHMPETFYVPALTVMVTMAINAATSGPFLPLYFMEMLPKFIALVAANVYIGTVVHNTLAVLVILGGIFTLKIAVNIAIINRTILRQKFDLLIAKDEVEQASRAKSAFLATMSHEVRTPLNGILGILNLMRDTRLDAKQDGYVETIRYSGETLLAMLNDILDFSKLDAGKFSVEKVDFDLHRLVKSVVDLMKSRADEKGIALTYKINMDVPDHVNTDPTRLRQILLNLIGNAIKFTERGHIELFVSNKGEEGWDVNLRFEVKDTGIGIPEEARASLFREFSQVDTTISRRFGGTGLGLAICEKIVGLLNGKIGVDSALSIGSRFWFEIPAEVAEYDEVLDVEADMKKDEYPLTAPLNILLVEDNKINQQVALGLLERLKHHVDIAFNGLEAVQRIREFDYDLVLMDMQMPIMDGLEATREIRAMGGKYATLPIIALTANALRGDDTRCLEAGMTDHVAKPIDPTDLYRKIALYAPMEKKTTGAFATARAVVHHTSVEKAQEWIKPIGVKLDHLSMIEGSLGKTYILDFIGNSLPEIERYISVLEQNDESDLDLMLHSAHELKSLSAMFGLMDVHSLAEGIEICCREHRGQEAVALAHKIRLRFNSNVDDLQKIYPIAYRAVQ